MIIFKIQIIPNMRKIAILTGFWTIFLFKAYAQIPSSGFEEWSSFDLPQLTDWYVVGNVEKTTTSTEGGIAIKLSNKPNSDVPFGMVLNTPLESEFQGGFAYSDRPFSLEFDARFDIDTRDTARIFALFSYEQNPVGAIDFRFTGSSADTFQHFMVPINWFGFVNPDSLVMLLASANFENEEALGAGEVYFDNLVFSSIGSPNDTINNQGFNRWHDLKVAHPEGWFTVDAFMASLTGVVPEKPLVTYSELEKREGNQSLHLTSRAFGEELTPGIAFTGTGFDDIEKPGFPVSRTFDYLRGQLKYEPNKGDEATVSVLMYKSGELIGFGEHTQSSQTDWIEFEVEIDYFLSMTPDSASIIISNSDLDKPQGENTEMWIDGLAFSTWSLTATPSVRTKITTYPNPVRNTLFISGIDDIEQVFLTDLMGQIILKTNDNRLELSSLPNGVYIITIKNSTSTWQRKIVKK